MRFVAKRVGQSNIPKDRRIVLNGARIIGEDYSGRELTQFTTIGCRLENCRFDNVRLESAQFGSGREPSEFIGCTFDGSHMRMGPGGYSRFDHCSFQNVDLRDWLCLEVEVIHCIFSGRIRRAIFNGRVRPEKAALLGREYNEFYGNDFSKVDLIDVGFRTGVDLRKQRLPNGQPYLYLPEPLRSLERARSGVTEWTDTGARQIALTMIKNLEDEVAMGQEQLFLRIDDYCLPSSLPRDSIEAIFALLRDEAG
jgi:hypothetical protein